MRWRKSGSRCVYLAAALALMLASEASSARGAIVIYSASDFGAGPTDPRPNSDAEHAAFLAAITNPADHLHTYDFEGLPLGQPGADNVPLNIGGGVMLTSQGLDHAPPPGFTFGVSNGPYDLRFGYNTTPGGTQFYQFAPLTGVGTGGITLSFPYETQAFGMYLTGLGTATNGPLHVMFNDGTAQDLTIEGSSIGGVQYFGFIDANKSFKSLTIALTGVTGSSREVFGIDDILTAAVPEPASGLLALVGLACALVPLGLHRARRR